MVDPKTSIEAGIAVINLSETMVKLIKMMRKDGHNPSIAAAIEQMPASAFTLTEQFENEVKAWRQRLVKADVDLKVSVNTLEIDEGWWAGDKDKSLRTFKPVVDSIRAQIETLLDDLVAVARCQGRNDLLAASYGAAMERKRALARNLDYDLPMGEILDILTSYAQAIHAEFGDLMH